MTALPADEPHHMPSNPKADRKVEVQPSTSKAESAYTAADAAEFSRRGASMVAWTDGESN